MVNIQVERTIAAPPEQVFAWLADPKSLTAAPLVVSAGWTNGSTGGGVGALRTVTATGMWFREEITAFDPPRSYSYRIVRSVPAFDHDGGTLTFTPSGGGTRVDWTSTYTHPPRGGGKAMEALSSRLLPWSFRAILARCAHVLES
ncbi:SRPBCC family protein [Mycolicibacterium sp. S2-37]|uniref:SRPBCC family protein n=1 Tax=Mycolicibacterium sp. S2-37 TaxID=2810297 RepID=UPI001A9415FD|nr:SRPBCC family protein [Mycolicibacterium sp. S2-37]MBO0678233.1 SRPBCC family protein [Mycolicibacterium sp. S2-37]